MQNSYSTSSTNGNGYDVGDLVGYNAANLGVGSTISNCYSTGAVSGSPKGGLVGQQDPTCTTTNSSRCFKLSLF